MDLEAMGLDFGLCRFRKYLVGAPDPISVVTDHKPLCPIFNGRSKGSIRTEKIKMRHQDVQFNVIYQKGMLNQTDFLSRRGKPLHKIPVEEQNELNDLNNLLYMLHTTPIIDHISIVCGTLDTNSAKTTLFLVKRQYQKIKKFLHNNFRIDILYDKLYDILYIIQKCFCYERAANSDLTSKSDVKTPN